MRRSDVELLRDALNFARHARDNAGGLSAEVLSESAQPLHAALYDLVVVGEALNKVTHEVKALMPAIPLRGIINLRNIIVHDYWQVDLEIIADVIANRIDPLMENLDKVLALVEQDGK